MPGIDGTPSSALSDRAAQIEANSGVGENNLIHSLLSIKYTAR